MNFILKSGNKTVANIHPRGESWLILLDKGVEPFTEEKVKSIFGACNFLLRETAAVSCRVFEFELVKKVEK